MKTIVITGSTRGIGYGLADAFLDLGCHVVINGRSPASVEKACQQLATQHSPDHLYGCAADMADLAQVEALWATAVAQFGQVDIWINNAGLGHDMLPMWQLPPERIKTIVDSNILGLMYGARVAIRGMLAQGHGQLYNMEGAGSNGHVRNGMSVYATSKAAVHLFSQALIQETEGTAVQVGTLSPGMVITDLLLDPMNTDPDIFARSQRIFNILSDRVETVTPFLAQKMLENDKSGAKIQWLTRPKMIWRFLSAPFSKRNPFGDFSPGSS
jgi:NAD(P)-dependent dehydrogenase (short-subunit alcohol dehydrogenase family)